MGVAIEIAVDNAPFPCLCQHPSGINAATIIFNSDQDATGLVTGFNFNLSFGRLSHAFSFRGLLYSMVN